MQEQLYQASKAERCLVNKSCECDGDVARPLPLYNDLEEMLDQTYDNNHESKILSINDPQQYPSTSEESYRRYHFKQNALLQFYPKQIQRLLTRRQKTGFASSNDRMVQGLKPPMQRRKQAKIVEKMSQLALCQINFMQVLFQKIDRKHKPIKKQEKIVNRNLKRKRIFLENENFDIMKILQQSIAEKTSPKKARQKNSPLKNVKMNLFNESVSSLTIPVEE